MDSPLRSRKRSFSLFDHDDLEDELVLACSSSGVRRPGQGGTMGDVTQQRYGGRDES
jgi:hypothetical protein